MLSGGINLIEFKFKLLTLLFLAKLHLQRRKNYRKRVFWSCI